MDFSLVAESFEKMTKTSSRTELTSILVDILKKTPKTLIAQIAYLTQGKLHPDFEGIELGMAGKTVAKAIAKAYSAEASTVQELMRKTGDLGDVAATLSEKRAQSLFAQEPLTVERVYSVLDEIAKTSGTGSAESKMRKLVTLLSSATSLEAKFLTRFVDGNLRLGVADFTVLDALAIAFTEDKRNREKLEKAYNLTSDLGLVAATLETKGMKSIEEIKVTIGKPVRPMLAERLSSSEEIIEQMNFDAACEYKLDGERIQGHVDKDGNVVLFSRRLEKITSHYPDVLEPLKTLARDLIAEGEVVAIGSDGKYLPFQELMHRRRKYDVEDAMKKYPVQLNLFDILYLAGNEKIDLPYIKRRDQLEKLYSKRGVDREKLILVPAQRSKSAAEIEEQMEKALDSGCEGLVIKDPNSTYRAGSREFAWVKYKPEYKTGVRDTLDLVIVGADYGKGRRVGTYGAFLLAAYDPDKDVFRTTTKVGTGFSDQDLQNFSDLLSNHKIKEKSPRVDAAVKVDDWFEPLVVIEVLPAEITLSPIYTAGLNSIREGSGLALRFPKFTGKIREDKGPEDATTVKEILELYQKQSRQFKSEKPKTR